MATAKPPVRSTAPDVWSPTKQMLTTYKKFQDQLDDFCRDNLKDGLDYGSITVKGQMTKPSLFKPGAEKLRRWFQLYDIYVLDTESLEQLGNPANTLIFFCFLMTRAEKAKALAKIEKMGKEYTMEVYRNLAIAEGRGAGTLGQMNDTTYNTLIKKAQKRAFVDATLRVFGVSDRFSQDLEDGVETASNVSGHQNAPKNAVRASQRALEEFEELYKRAIKLVSEPWISEKVKDNFVHAIEYNHEHQNLEGMKGVVASLERQKSKAEKAGK